MDSGAFNLRVDGPLLSIPGNTEGNWEERNKEGGTSNPCHCRLVSMGNHSSVSLGSFFRKPSSQDMEGSVTPWIVPPSVEGLLQGLAPPYPGLCGQRLGTVRVSPRANTADMFNGSKAGCCQATPACSWQSGQEPGHGDGLTRVLGWLQAHSGFLGLWSQQPLMLPS